MPFQSYWKEALNHDFENEPVNIGQSATHPLNISFWTCKQARSFYVSKTFQTSTSKAENRSFRAVNLCLIVARYYIYTAAKESESYSITAFKVLLKSKLSAESPSIRASVSF